MAEISNVSHIKELEENNDIEKEIANERSKNEMNRNTTVGEVNGSEKGTDQGKENKENTNKQRRTSTNETIANGIKPCLNSKSDGKEDTVKEQTKTSTEPTGQEAKGTSSDSVSINMAEGSSQGGVVITTAPVATGQPKPKPKLERRKSLNPRVMTPPGLEVLDNIQLLAIRQQMEMDIHSGCGAPNTYRVWDVNDEQIFFATEESGCLCRWACGPARPFSLDIFSASDDQVLNFHRMSCRCDCCCCLDCLMCLQKLYVVDCLGRTLGAIKQKFSVFNAKFDIVDHDNNVLFKVLGPCCPCRCATEIYFQLLNKTGERQIGRIQKKWGGDRTDNVNVDHEYFDVTFPAKLDSVDKALILGAAFLVNCMYLEMS